MNSDDLKQFMKPKIGFGLSFSILLVAVSILAFCIGQVWPGLLALAIGLLFFYIFVFYEWNIYRKNLKNFEAKRILGKLSAEFREAEVLPGIQTVRFGKKHLFLQYKSKVFPYDEIVALEQRIYRKTRKTELRIQSKGENCFLPYHALSWSGNSLAMESVTSSLNVRNPDIRVVRNEI